MSFTFPLDEIYVAFGDGSVTPGGVFYGLVLVPERNVKIAQHSLSAIKLKHGGKATTPLHCRELFSKDARNKSEWAHISDAGAVELCGDVLRELASLQPKYLLSFVTSDNYPKRLRLVGKNGHPDLVHKIDEKWLTLPTYFWTAALLDPVETIVPADPIITPSPRNLPFWRIGFKRTDRGPYVRSIFLDREETNVRWFSKTFKWTTVVKELVVDGPKGPSHLPLQFASDKKHPLLEVADIFTYSIARSLSQGKPLEYRDFEAEVFAQPLLFSKEEWVLGGTSKP